MGTGDLFAGLNALDVVRVKRDNAGAYAGMVSDSEHVPVTDMLNHGSQHDQLGLPAVRGAARLACDSRG